MIALAGFVCVSFIAGFAIGYTVSAEAWRTKLDKLIQKT